MSTPAQPLPRALYDKMIAAKNFQSGMQTLRQVEFGLFDLLLHSEFAPGRQGRLDLLAEVRREVAVLQPPEWNRFPNSFSHIFGGGYAAGYYSYKWAEVLSADAYEAFEEADSEEDLGPNSAGNSAGEALLPSISVGRQSAQRLFEPTKWNDLLDAATYPANCSLSRQDPGKAS
jgi:Zn-dependent oligopeptidase